MGSPGVIARRLSDGRVEYGYAGLGGYYRFMGMRLLGLYNTPKMVDYLFGLGELRQLGLPYSESGKEHILLKNILDGHPHRVGQSEENIWNRIAFVQTAYFYENDGHWYHVEPGIFRIKIPLEHIRCVSQDGENDEFEYIEQMQVGILKYILGDYLSEDPMFVQHLGNCGVTTSQIMETLFAKSGDVDDPLRKFWRGFRSVAEYFDPWIVVQTEDEYRSVCRYKLRRRTEKHVETCDW